MPLYSGCRIFKVGFICHAICCSELFFLIANYIFCSSVRKKNAFVAAGIGVSLFVQTLDWV